MIAIIISAPSGAGKSTIVHHLMERFPQLGFSVSACSRRPRGNEVDGVDYHFLSVDEFRKKIKWNGFVEWQEVYPGSYYGTLKSELERLRREGKVPLFDVDVVGGVSLKIYFASSALSIFIKPLSLQVLEERLRNRGNDSEESLQKRLAKAEKEMTYAPQFDCIVVNDNLERAIKEVEKLVRNWILDAANCQLPTED
ncbi:MAG: guanylate kinase [Bacteroidetes bacterium]|nr:MAG: guanylate kinase [Bacteroidota bacterium]